MPEKYRKLALHNRICNEVYFKLQDCEKEHPVSRFIGECTHFSKELERCIKQNRQRMRTENADRAREKHFQRKQASL